MLERFAVALVLAAVVILGDGCNDTTRTCAEWRDNPVVITTTQQKNGKTVSIRKTTYEHRCVRYVAVGTPAPTPTEVTSVQPQE